MMNAIVIIIMENTEMNTGEIIPLYTDYYCDLGEVNEFRWLGRWTAKSLVITADPTDDRIPLAYRSAKYVVPRTKAEKELANERLYHSSRAFYVKDSIDRQIEYERNLEADPVYQANRERERQTQKAFDDLPEVRKETIRLLSARQGIQQLPSISHILNKYIDENGGDELVRAKLTSKSYRSIDAE